MRFNKIFKADTSSRADQKVEHRGLERYRKGIAEQAARALATVPATVSCTLTAVKFVRTDNQWKGLLLHMGDSSAYTCRDPWAEFIPLTRKNFWLAGRTRRLYQIEWLETDPDTLLVMTTDGIADLTGGSLLGTRITSADLIHPERVEEIPEALLRTKISSSGHTDDAAVIALVPGNIVPANACVILGGTTGAQEKAYIHRCRTMQYTDRDLPLYGDTPHAYPVI